MAPVKQWLEKSAAVTTVVIALLSLCGAAIGTYATNRVQTAELQWSDKEQQRITADLSKRVEDHEERLRQSEQNRAEMLAWLAAIGEKMGVAPPTRRGGTE